MSAIGDFFSLLAILDFIAATVFVIGLFALIKIGIGQEGKDGRILPT
jgi:hypothetical protein